MEWAVGSMNPGAYPYPVGFDINIPYFNLDTGKFRLLMRFPAGEFGCPLHRHYAVTETFVLRGHQMVHRHADADNWRVIRAAAAVQRETGAYDRSGGPKELPHLEHGGTSGGLVLLAMDTHLDDACPSDDGLLFQYFNDDLTLKNAKGRKRLTIENVVAGTRSQNAAAVTETGSDELYQTVLSQFGFA